MTTPREVCVRGRWRQVPWVYANTQRHQSQSKKVPSSYQDDKPKECERSAMIDW